jgi:hypothetical protein
MAISKTTKGTTPKPTKKELSANNYLVMVVGISLVVVVAAAFAGSTLIPKIITNIKVMSGKQRAVSDLNDKVERAPKLIAAYDQLGSRQTLIMNALPTTSDFPQLISIAEAMGAAAGVQVKSVTPTLLGSDSAIAPPAAGSAAAGAAPAAPATTSPAAGQFTNYNFSVQVVGSYPRILEMLKNIETSARPLKIGAVEFRGDGSTLNADIHLTTFYQGPAKIDDTMEAVK